MSKTNEELNKLKEVESVNEKLQELTPEELEQVTGGSGLFRFSGKSQTDTKKNVHDSQDYSADHH